MMVAPVGVVNALHILSECIFAVSSAGVVVVLLLAAVLLTACLRDASSCVRLGRDPANQPLLFCRCCYLLLFAVRLLLFAVIAVSCC